MGGEKRAQQRGKQAPNQALQDTDPNGPHSPRCGAAAPTLASPHKWDLVRTIQHEMVSQDWSKMLNWIFTFHTSRPDSWWFHLGKLPWASAEVRVQRAGKPPSSISWEQEQPMAGADMPGKPLWLHAAPTMEHRPGLIRSFQANRKEAALFSCTTSAEPERSEGSWWLLALMSGHLSNPWGSNTSRGIPRP